MNQVLSPRELAAQWLDITVEHFVANLRRLRVQDTGALLASFKKEVIGAAAGDQLRLRLSYALYGKFIDMGVGRGTGAGVRQGDDGYNRIRNSRRRQRQARTWYATEMAHQAHRLAELVLDHYGTLALATTQDVAAQTSLTL